MEGIDFQSLPVGTHCQTIRGDVQLGNDPNEKKDATACAIYNAGMHAERVCQSHP